MRNTKLNCFILLLLVTIESVFAMNVKSLEIAYETHSGLSCKAYAIFYLYDPSPIDESIEFNWGDNSTTNMNFQSVQNLPGELKKVTYSGSHVYSGPSTFTAYVSYSVRSTNVLNISNSLITDIYSQAEIVISPFLGESTSPVFIEPPKLNVCLDTISLINFSAFDQDGDDLIYTIIDCRGDNGENIPGYFRPSATNSFSIESNSGLLTWNSPIYKGFYNYAIKVSKYRNGVFIGSVMRDALVNVINCSPISADLTTPNDTCILVDNIYKDTISATYAGIDTISLSVYGEPLHVTPQMIVNSPVRGQHSVQTALEWNSGCSLIRTNPYKLYFSAELEDSLSNCNCTYNFNNQHLSPFISNVPVLFNNPCSNGWDDSFYAWIGADSTAPRYIASPAIDISDGNYMVIFDMRMEEHTGEPGTDCEGPDEPAEGIYLQYSLSGINGPWVSMAYWDPSLSPDEGGHVRNLIEWNNYSIVVPDEAYSTQTRFRWIQFEATNAFYDHWGLDNIAVYKISDKKPSTKEQNIKIICPAPQNLTATPSGNSIILDWENCICSNAIGYKIYRKSSFYGYTPDICETGVPEYTGYTLIASIDSVENSHFIDNNNGLGLPNGNTYCYMVIAFFADSAESQASNEACTNFPDNVPVITNVSIRNTNITDGSAYIAWSKPNDLDMTAFPGPYKYEIFRNIDNTNEFESIGFTENINDTTFIDTLLNTNDNNWNYYIKLLYANGSENYQECGNSYKASSVFLNISPLDKRLQMNWNFDVPWTNDSFAIFRYNETTSAFDSIATTIEKTYLDTGLVNGKEYCYYIKSIGRYSLPGTIFPIVNNSQRACAMPKDLEPPCKVQLWIETNCDSISNTLKWQNPENLCGNLDVASYEIYYSQMPNTEMALLTTITEKQDTIFTHKNINSIAGCYAVLSIDSVGNKSDLSNAVCIDINVCDLYRLPNIFTPNGDGENDLFCPFPFDFVEKIDMTIFNRWGTVVFKTTDPNVNWDGKNINSNNDCSEGVYFYICDVYELTLAGESKRTLSGTVHLYR